MMKIKMRVAKNALVGLLVLVISTVMLFAWQFYSLVKATDAARKGAVQEWVITPSVKIGFLLQYEAECERSLVGRDEAKSIIEPLTHTECAVQLANRHASASEGRTLGQAMESAINRVEIAAPLRWLL